MSKRAGFGFEKKPNPESQNFKLTDGEKRSLQFLEDTLPDQLSIPRSPDEVRACIRLNFRRMVQWRKSVFSKMAENPDLKLPEYLQAEIMNATDPSTFTTQRMNDIQSFVFQNPDKTMKSQLKRFAFHRKKGWFEIMLREICERFSADPRYWEKLKKLI